MDLIYIGKLVNTHGINGEVRIVSDFKYKMDVFKKDNKIYINKLKYTIKSYRKHKIYDMLVFNEIDRIEAAEKLKGYNIYIERKDYNFSGYLDEDLIGLDVYDNDIYKGKIIDIYKTKKDDLFVIDGIKRHMIPNNNIFVKNIDIINKKIYINYIKGLDNED